MCSIPRIQDPLDCLDGAPIFTSLNLHSGYWQVEWTEASKSLTAFTVGPLEFYKCIHMPFGLTNTPAMFQHLMEPCLGDMTLNWCIIYLDDIIVFSKTLEDHTQRLRGVFEKLSAAGLQLKPSKCDFFKSLIAYLGHIVLKDGIETDPKKIATIKDWLVPKTVTEVQSLCHDTHSAIFLSRDFFALDPFLSHDFSRRKNVLCVHGTIEIALERIQRDIAANLRRQKRREFALCVS